jgi:hypothetical protein
MIKREDILDCYRFLLDRLPENERVVDEKSQTKNLENVVAAIVAGPEFLEGHKVAIARYLRAKSQSK